MVLAIVWIDSLKKIYEQWITKNNELEYESTNNRLEDVK